jgi:hypothetical protein
MFQLENLKITGYEMLVVEIYGHTIFWHSVS